MNRFTRTGLAAAVLLSLTAMGSGTVFAALVHDSGDTVEADTVQLNWTGNGVENGKFAEQCGQNADPGHLGYENGATADNYMLWIFNATGQGTTTGPVTITINGTTYADTNDGHQIVTPAYDPTTITNAHTNFVVDNPGTSGWVLTISHGCGGTVEDEFIPPDGQIFGPCADPAYYAFMDNSAGNTLVKFRFRWYNNNGLNTSVKWLAPGDTFTTWQHWAKPGTKVTLSYKDPNTLLWVQLDQKTVAKGRFPACEYTPGWTHQAV